ILRGPGGPPGTPGREGARRFRNRLNRFLNEEGVLVAVSPGDRTDGGTVRSTAAGSREESDAVPPPSVALTPEHYNRIVRLIDKKVPVTLEFDIQNKFHEDAREMYNVTAELPGTDKKDEVVMLGAHLDSWTGGTGATDNAAGSSVVMEAIRVLKAADLRPRRTVRVALWTGEEQGLLGSRAYVKEHFADRETMELKPEHARLAGYFNLDNGSGKIRGVYLQGNDMMRPVFEAWLGPFKDLGATTITIRNTSGTDHLSFDAVGLPGFQFVQDPLEYSSRTHHTNMDVYDRLQKADLMQASAVMASFVYHAASRDAILPRKPLPKAQPQSGIKTDVPFTRIGETALTLDASVPEGDGPFPAVIVVHGGGFINGDKQTFVKPLFDPLSEANFSWFTINYRLAPQHKFPAAVEDVEKAVAYVRANAKRYKVDPNRIALMGESAGGHLVSMVGARNRPEAKVQAVVSFYGPHDFESRETGRGKVTEPVEKFLGVSDLGPKSLKIMRDASPITHVKAGMPPYLLIHGTKDAQVPYDQSPKMCEKMQAAGNSCEVFTVEDGPHGVGAWEKVAEHQKYKTKMIEWLKVALK
ncbi:MAG: M20/M25/M40 family metallo-hydrolase, partial [Bryobacteraceae bacterium]